VQIRSPLLGTDLCALSGRTHSTAGPGVRAASRSRLDPRMRNPAALTPGNDSCRRIAAAERSGALLPTLGLVGNCKAEPFTAEDPFDFAQGRLFAKLRTGSEDAEEYILDSRDYRNGLGYMGEGNRARRSGEPRYPRQLPTRQLSDGRPSGSNLRPPRQLVWGSRLLFRNPYVSGQHFSGFSTLSFEQLARGAEKFLGGGLTSGRWTSSDGVGPIGPARRLRRHGSVFGHRWSRSPT
jgi:hypothetical protein